MHPVPVCPAMPLPLIARPHPEILERLEAQITELWGYLNAATYRFLALVAEFDRHQGYARHVPAEHRALAQLAMRHRHDRGAREGSRGAGAREPSRDSRGLRERRVLVFEGARDDACRDARERRRAREHRAPRHRVACREARAQVPLDAAPRRGKDCAVAAPQPFSALVLRRQRHVRVECAPAARDRRARRASAPSSRGRAARAGVARRTRRAAADTSMSIGSAGRASARPTRRTGPTHCVSSPRRFSRCARKKPRRRQARTDFSSSCTSTRPC